MDFGTVKAEVRVDGKWRFHVAPAMFGLIRQLVGAEFALRWLNGFMSSVRVRMRIQGSQKWETIANGIRVHPNGDVEGIR